VETTIDEIAPDTFRLSTVVPEAAPGGFTFNQFLVRDEQPFLFHTGMRGLHPLVSAAVARLVPVADLRWISFAHVEADECGAMNLFLGGAPGAKVVHGELACMLSVADLADRPPQAMADGEVLDLGTHRLRFVPTPHVPHNWERGCGSTRRRRPCSRATCSPRRASVRPSPRTASWSRPWPPRSCSTRRPSCPTCRPPCTGSPTSSP
jgi:hypothetical protein